MKIASYSLNWIMLFFVACSSASPPPQVQLPPSLSIASIGVAGTASDNTWSPDNPIRPVLGCSGNPLIVTIEPEPVQSTTGGFTLDGFTLDVPGNCVSATSCGWLVLRIDNEIVIAASTVPITVDDPIEPGSHTFSLELHDASDRLVKGSDNAPVGGQVTVEFIRPGECPDSKDRDAG
jgi:hypothetical protein